MDQVFKQVQKEDGSVEFVEVNADELPTLLSDEQIRQTKAYKATLDESVERRQALVGYKQQVQTLQSKLDAQTGMSVDDSPLPKPEAPPEPEPEPAPEPATPLNEDELFENFLARMDKRKADEQVAASARKQELDELMKQHGLTEESRFVLDNSSDPQATAAYLGRLNTRFDDVRGGELPTTDDEVKGLGQSVLEKLGLND